LTDEFITFAQKCEEISLTKSNNEKVKILSIYLSELTSASLPIVVLLLSGRVFALGSGLLLKVAYSTIMSALSDISHLSAKEANRIYLKHGDLGSLVEYSLSQKLTKPLVDYSALTLAGVYQTLTKIAQISGVRSQSMRKKILAGLLMKCTPLEGKYLSKVLTNELRIGLSEGLLITAISKAFGVSLDSVRNALLVTGNISQISLLAKKNMLDTAKMRPLSPISFMLADVMYSPSEIVNYFHKDLIAEYKYDGIRAQIHIHGNKVKIFSRNLNDITSFFPELVQGAVENIEQSKMILDGEILAFKNEEVMPFQYLQRRLHTKNLISDSTGSVVGVLYTIFDALYIDRELINLPLIQRKKILNNVKVTRPFALAKWRLVNSEEIISDMFTESRNMGYEGLVLKDPQSEYQIGKRGRNWVKFKKELDTLDVVVVIAEYGHGKRAGMLSDYTFAIKKSENEDQLLTIGKAYSGVSDKEITDLTSEFQSIAARTDGYRIWVEPKIVLEVSFDSIQKSERHESGYALRFPRIKAIRRDKSLMDIDNLGKVLDIYSRQKFR
jgi:DNA ligase 1